MMIHKVFNKTSYVCYRFALAEDKIKYYDQKIQKSMLNAGLTNFFPLYIAKGKREETDLRKGRRWQCYSGPSIGDTGAQLTISVLFFFYQFPRCSYFICTLRWSLWNVWPTDWLMATVLVWLLRSGSAISSSRLPVWDKEFKYKE